MRSGIAIIGCGGVGSNLAYMLTRADEKPEKVILIDHDTVSEGNLSRQMFTVDDVGQNKAEALGAMLKQMNPEILFETYDQKIESEADLAIITNVAYTFVCTDNMESKRLIDKARDNHSLRGTTFFVGCEQDYFEVKNRLDDGDKATWSLESGYNSTQAARSNISAAFFLYDLWCGHYENVNSIIQLSEFNRIVRNEVSIETNTIQLSKNKKELWLHSSGGLFYFKGNNGKRKRFDINVPVKILFNNSETVDKLIKEAVDGGLQVYTSEEDGTRHIYKADLESVIEKRNKPVTRTTRRRTSG